MSCTLSAISMPILEPGLPPLTHSALDEIDSILEDQFIVSAYGGYQRFHISWKNRLNIDNSWITESEFRRIDPAFSKSYLQANSSDSSFSKSIVIKSNLEIKNQSFQECSTSSINNINKIILQDDGY